MRIACDLLTLCSKGENSRYNRIIYCYNRLVRIYESPKHHRQVTITPVEPMPVQSCALRRDAGTFSERNLLLVLR
jgi:hypothetical protein